MLDVCVWDARDKSPRLARRGYVEESMAHPAKADIALTRAILEHYSEPGMLVLDPMAGIGTTLVEAVLMGRHAIGVELEDHWAAIAALNVAHARHTKIVKEGGKSSGFGLSAVYVGDARTLRSLAPFVAKGAVFTPPRPWGELPRQLPLRSPATGEVLDVAPILQELAGDDVLHNGRHDGASVSGPAAQDVSPLGNSLSDSGGNRAALDAQDLSADLAVLSPPYGSRIGEGSGWVKRAGWGGVGLRALSVSGYTDLHDLKNIGNLRLDLSVFSPPYGNRYEKRTGSWPGGDPRDSHAYGEESPDQIGSTRNRKGYLEAMAAVYGQIYACLKPGGIMVLITKDSVRDFQRVPLGRLTTELCAQVGFRLRPCPANCKDFQAGFLHTHKSPLQTSSFWIRRQEAQFKAKFPGARSPYVHHEDLLVLIKD